MYIYSKTSKNGIHFEWMSPSDWVITPSRVTNKLSSPDNLILVWTSTGTFWHIVVLRVKLGQQAADLQLSFLSLILVHSPEKASYDKIPQFGKNSLKRKDNLDSPGMSSLYISHKIIVYIFQGEIVDNITD